MSLDRSFVASRTNFVEQGESVLGMCFVDVRKFVLNSSPQALKDFDCFIDALPSDDDLLHFLRRHVRLGAGRAFGLEVCELLEPGCQVVGDMVTGVVHSGTPEFAETICLVFVRYRTSEWAILCVHAFVPVQVLFPLKSAGAWFACFGVDHLARVGVLSLLVKSDTLAMVTVNEDSAAFLEKKLLSCRFVCEHLVGKGTLSAACATGPPWQGNLEGTLVLGERWLDVTILWRSSMCDDGRRIR